MIKKILVKSIFSLFIPSILKLFFLCKNKNVFIFDIDNTITETGLFLQKNGDLVKRNEVIEMVSKLEIDLEMKKLIQYVDQFKNTEVIFLTARSYYLYPHTKKWLKRNLDINKLHLIMVMEANDKFPILKLISKAAKELTLVDDLTYGHESGMIKYHKELIEDIHKIKGINYINLDTITLIKSSQNSFIKYIKV